MQPCHSSVIPDYDAYNFLHTRHEQNLADGVRLHLFGYVVANDVACFYCR